MLCAGGQAGAHAAPLPLCPSAPPPTKHGLRLRIAEELGLRAQLSGGAGLA